MKRLLRVVLVLLLLVIAAVVVGLVMIDSIAKTAVEEGGTYALGVDTTLEAVSIKLLRGQMNMDGLRVANPEGFTSPHLMNSGHFEMELVTGSVLSDTIELPKIELDGLDVWIEQKAGGTNVSKVIDNLKRLSGPGEPEDQDQDEPGKKVKVDSVVIRNVVAHFHLLGDLAPTGPITVKVPEIKLTNISSDDGGGVVMAQLMRRLVSEVLAAIVDGAKGTVPADFLKDLDAQVAGAAKAVAENAGKMVKDAADAAAKSLGEGTGKAVKDAADAAGKALGEGADKAAKDARGVLDGLLGGKKEDTDKPKP